jgi:uncharacterized membrane protein YkvA (DUF1232 family)
MFNLRSLYRQLKKEAYVYKLVLADKETPKMGKFFLGMAVGYFFLPFDLIPDFIPVLGQLDDALIIPLLLYIAFRLIPPELVEKHRRSVDKSEGLKP